MDRGRDGGRESQLPLDEMRAYYVRRWNESPSQRPRFGPLVDGLHHWSAALKGRLLIEEMDREIRRIPAEAAQQEKWRESLRERIQSYGMKHLGWPSGYRRLMLGDSFFDAALRFVDEARRFDKAMKPEHIGQALRNVWIGNSLQMLLGREVGLRPGLFAYSMLYPVTDNWLDDPRTTDQSKSLFNERFGQRLAGRPMEPEHDIERASFELVAMIEEEFPRHRFPLVYSSLLAINSAQTIGIEPQRTASLTDEGILDISVRKGGASVLPDLYLVAPDANDDERRFAFGYGVFLQLLDDFQDVDADLASGHETLFTRAARRGSLDDIVSKLSYFTESILDSEAPLARDDDRIDAVRRNCRILFVNALADNRRRLTKRFLSGVEEEWPLTLDSQTRLMGHLERIFFSMCDEKAMSALNRGSVPRR